jgi:hypothetical protein
MSGARDLTGIVFVLGTLLLLTSLMTPGGIAAWTNFRSTLDDNPFSQQADPYTLLEINETLLPVSNGTYPPLDWTGTIPDCNITSDESTYWKCLVSNDGFDSALTPSASLAYTVSWNATPISLPDWPSHSEIQGLTIRYECQANIPGPPYEDMLGIAFELSARSDPGTVLATAFSYRSCINPEDDLAMANYTEFESFQGGLFTSGINASFLAEPEIAARILFDADHPGPLVVWISHVQVDALILTQRFNKDIDCEGLEPFAHIACALSQFGNWVADAFAFGMGFLLWLGMLIINFFVGVTGAFSAMFSLGAPSPFQEIFDLFIIAMVVFLVLKLAGTVRGGNAL